MNFIRKNCKEAWKFLKDNLSLTIIVCTILFIIFLMLGIVFGINNQEITNNILNIFFTSKEDIILENGNLSDFALIKNNTFACIMSILYGFFPVIFLTIFSIILNGFMVGVVLGFGKATAGASILKTLILGILPHGVFEIPALIISMSMGIYLCLELTKKMFGRGKHKITKLLIDYIRIFVCLILPMIILAGIIESNITPLLLK